MIFTSLIVMACGVVRRLEDGSQLTGFIKQGFHLGPRSNLALDENIII